MFRKKFKHDTCLKTLNILELSVPNFIPVLMFFLGQQDDMAITESNLNTVLQNKKINKYTTILVSLYDSVIDQYG